mmetsp:Transcript_52979/g.124106  ORF Transcript_52979/g.124106 Transcript_52979/m.124106 type:complete len:425 (-) Transcript_52979:99-1373(-)
MKFGRIMAARRTEDLRYISYDALKHKIKEQDGDASLESVQAFHESLQSEITEVDAVFRSQLEQNAGVGVSSDRATRVIAPVELRTYAVLNYLAVLKILKKHDRMMQQIRVKQDDVLEADRVLSAVSRGLLFQASFCAAMIDSPMFWLSDGACQTQVHAFPSMVSLRGQDSTAQGEEDSCPVCLENVADPAVLPHKFCYACLAGCAASGINSCPLCRKEQTLNPVNLEIETILGCASSRYYPGNQQEVSRPSSPLLEEPSTPTDSETHKASSAGSQGRCASRTPSPRPRPARAPASPRTPPPRPRRISFTTPPPLRPEPIPDLLKALMKNSLGGVMRALELDPEAARVPFLLHGVEPPLCAAVRFNCSVQVIELLLRYAAKVNASDLRDQTPVLLLDMPTSPPALPRTPEQRSRVLEVLRNAGAQ